MKRLIVFLIVGVFISQVDASYRKPSQFFNRKPSLGNTVVSPQMPTKGLIMYWPMLEGGGQTVYDYSGNHNDCTFNGSPIPSWTPGKFGTDLTFNAANSQYLDCGTPFAGQNFVNISMSGWMYKATTNSNIAVFGFSDNNTFECTIIWYSDGNAYISVENNGANFPDAAVPTGGWHHFALTFDGTLSGLTALNFYLDGIKTPLSGSFNNTSYICTGHFRIGNQNSDGRFTTGKIDDVRFYNRTLSASEVQALAANPYQSFVPTRFDLISQQPSQPAPPSHQNIFYKAILNKAVIR